MVRTTLTIDDDVLMAAKELADRDRKTVGEVLTELARKSLAPSSDPPRYRNGIRLLPSRRGGAVVTPELVKKLLDDEEFDRAVIA